MGRSVAPLCLAACTLICATATAARNAHTAGARILIIGGRYGDDLDPVWANAELYDPESNSFIRKMPHMHQARADAAPTELSSGPNAGKVLVLSGFVNDATEGSASTELYDPATIRFLRGPDMQAVHQPQATVTGFTSPQGEMEILIAGGDDKNNRYVSSTEIYNTATNRFVRGPNMLAGREFATATLLSSGPNVGKVLIAGGCCDHAKGHHTPELASTELYDPATNSFERGPNLRGGREKHTATLIETGPNAGKILIAGGERNLSYLATTEIYDPRANKFEAGPTMNVARDEHTATTSPAGKNRGKILLVGGYCGEDECAPPSGYLRSTELYDPNTNTFAAPAATARMDVARVGHTATVIPTGKYAGWVLIAGGATLESTSIPTMGYLRMLASTELYDPDDNKFVPGPSMNLARDSATAIVVP